MRLGRLILSRLRRDTTPLADRKLTLVVGRDGTATSGAAAYPRSALVAFSSVAIIPASRRTATARSFKSSASLPLLSRSATIPARVMTVDDATVVVVQANEVISTATIAPFSSIATTPVRQRVAIPRGFQSTIVLPGRSISATTPSRITTVEDVWLTSP